MRDVSTSPTRTAGISDAASLIRMAKAVETWPDGPKKAGAKRRIANRARELGIMADGDNDYDGDVPSKVPGGMGYVPPGPVKMSSGPDTAARRALAARGQALPGGRFPIPDKDYLSKAIRAVGRAKGNHDAVRRYIIRRAKALGADDMIPSHWKANGGRTLVAKMRGKM